MYRILPTLKAVYPSYSKHFDVCYKTAKKINNDYLDFHYSTMDSYKEHVVKNLFENKFLKMREILEKDLIEADIFGIGEKVAKKIKKIKDPKAFLSFYKFLYEFIETITDKTKITLSKKMSHQYEANSLDKKINEAFLNIYSIFYRFITPKTIKSEILAIEDEIRKMGVKEVRLGEDIDGARLVFQGVLEAFKNGDRLPTKIFIPEFAEDLVGKTLGCTYRDNSINQSVITFAPSKLKKILRMLNRKKDKMLQGMPAYLSMDNKMRNATKAMLYNERFSTNDARQVVLHEIGHVNKKIELPRCTINDLSIKDRITIFNLTGYVNTDNILTELHVEFYAKIRAYGMQSLTNDELDLWKRLNNGYFNKLLENEPN